MVRIKDNTSSTRSWLSYIKYLFLHKYYVALACFKIGLYWRGLTHDLSKFRPGEFFPYAAYFFGTWKGNPTYEAKPPISTSKDYDVAWNRHKNRNEHHWQYWVTINDNREWSAAPMTKVAAEEMICDWYGAGKAQNNPDTTRQWFESKKDKLVLHGRTIEHIYNTLDKLEEKT